MEYLKPELELFQKPIYQNQIEKSIVREFTPISSLQHQTPVEFLVTPIEGYMPDLSRSYLYVKAKITTAAGENIAANAPIGPINLPIHSMWSGIEVYLNDTRISDANSMYPYRAIIETLLSYSPEALSSQKETAIYAKDKAGKMEEGKIDAGENTGLVKRAAYFAESAEAEMMDRLHIDIAYPELFLPTSLPIRLRLNRSPDHFAMISDPGTAAHKLVINTIKLYVPFMALSDAQQAAFEIAIMHSPVRIPIRRVALKHLTIPSGLSTTTNDNIIMGRLPKRIIIALVSETAMSGALKENPFNFQHFTLNYMALHVNGDIVPTRPFTPNFATGQYIREYMALFDAMNITNKGRGIIIDRTDFGQGYALFAFDLSSDQSPNAQSYDARRTGHVRLDMRFSTALPKAINVIIYGEYLGEILIDKYRNVITDF